MAAAAPAINATAHPGSGRCEYGIHHRASGIHASSRTKKTRFHTGCFLDAAIPEMLSLGTSPRREAIVVHFRHHAEASGDTRFVADDHTGTCASPRANSQ